MSTPVLRMDNVTVSLPRRGRLVPVLEELTLSIGAGEMLALVGETGSGKTMAALSIPRLLPPGASLSGSILLNDQELTALPEDRLKSPPRVLTVGARYDRMMEAFGGKGWFIEDPKDLKGALDAAMAFNGPALVNVRLHPDAGRKPQQVGWHTS